MTKNVTEAMKVVWRYTQIWTTSGGHDGRLRLQDLWSILPAATLGVSTSIGEMIGSAVSDVGDMTSEISDRGRGGMRDEAQTNRQMILQLRHVFDVDWKRLLPSGVCACWGFFFLLSPYTGFFFGTESSLDGTSIPWAFRSSSVASALARASFWALVSSLPSFFSLSFLSFSFCFFFSLRSCSRRSCRCYIEEVSW